ncbi:MAG: aromatic acid exporter family protein [Porcipelethomonas sp.]
MLKNHLPEIHIGMRIWKTVIAVSACAVLGMIFDIHPFYSMIAAILCMQSNTSQSIKKGAVRLVGTLIGGAGAVLILLLIDFTPLEPFSVLYYAVISLCIAPLIYTNVLLGQEASSYITCVVFLSVVLSHFEGENHYLFALQRMLETAAGIVISVVINKTISNNDE